MKFNEGQQVEVEIVAVEFGPIPHWRKAKIVKLWNSANGHIDRPDDYKVEFLDGTTGVFDEEYIRRLS